MKLYTPVRREHDGDVMFTKTYTTEKEANDAIDEDVAKNKGAYRRSIYGIHETELDGSEIEIPCFLHDALCDGENDGPSLKCAVRINGMGVALHIDGFGDCGTEPGHGEPVYVENRHGVPTVVVWADINQEDPTDIIELAGAAEALRKENN